MSIKESSLYKEAINSPTISPNTEAPASAQTLKTSMAARIREIAQGFNREFTVGEISLALVKSLSISPHPSTPDVWGPWNKHVSNELGRRWSRLS